MPKNKNIASDVKNDDLQIIFDSVPAWIFYKNSENKFIKVNEAFCKVMGKTRDELEGTSLYDLFSKEQADAYLRDDLEVISTRKAKRNIVEPMDSKGKKLWVKTDKIPYVDINGKIIGVIGFSIDITSLKEIEDELREKLIQIEKLNSFMVDREVKMAELKEKLN